MKSDHIPPVEILATYMQMRPESRLRLVGPVAALGEDDHDSCVDAVCRILIQAGVHPERIQAGGTFDHVGFPVDCQHDLPTREVESPQMLLRAAEIARLTVAGLHDRSDTDGTSNLGWA